jgi:hypothetical protein
MAQFEPLLWDRRPRRARRLRSYAQSSSPIDPGSEFEDRPLGRLGRRLLSDVEDYLEFFALARQPASSTDTA